MKSILFVAGALLSFVGAALASEPVSGRNAAWFVAAERRLQPPTTQQIDAARSELRTALERFEAILETLPNGRILQRELGLTKVHEALAAAQPAAGPLDEVEPACRIRVVAPAEEAFQRLREAVAQYRGRAAADAESLAHARRALQTLQQTLPPLGRQPGGDEERTIRRAYAELAQTHLLDDLLAGLRQQYSQPNHVLTVSKRQLETIGAPRYDVPLNITQTRKGQAVRATGAVHLTRSLELLDSPHVAELRIRVSGYGRTAITATQPRSEVVAHSQEALQGTQHFQLTPRGTVAYPPALHVAHHSVLDSVSVAARCRLGAPLRQRMADRRARQALADSDPRIAADAERKISAQVYAQTQDFADHVQAMFHRLYWDNLEVLTIEPRLRTASTPHALTWQAELAMPSQIGALSAPPVSASIAAQADMVHAVHESALNNLAPAWGGRRLDEAIWRAFARERFKLQPPATAAPPRPPASLQLADEQPFALEFRDNRCGITLQLQAYEVEPGGPVATALTVRTVYEVVVTPQGAGLRRVEFACHGTPEDSAAAQVVARFLPDQWEPLPRFNNTVSPQTLRMQQILWRDGWLIMLAAHAGQVAEHGARSP